MKLAKPFQLKQIYQLFEDSFIPSELRPYDSFVQMFNKQELKIYIEEKELQIIVALIVWEFEDYIFLENFAVNEMMRGHGLGGIFLEKLKELYPNHFMILEVEEDSDEVKHRRIQFYQRHQWIFNSFHYRQPQLRENTIGEELYMMSYPNPLNEQQFLKIKKDLFDRVYQCCYKEREE